MLFKKINVSGNHTYISPCNWLAKGLENIEIPKLGKGLPINVHYVASNSFALHDLVIYLAKKIGQCHVRAVSFNISSKAARNIVLAIDDGRFKSFVLILNTQKKHQFKEALNIVGQRAVIRFAKVHAKVALIWNDEYKISITTSCNLSNNTNLERGTLTTNIEIFDFDKEWTDQLLNT
jgi:hypothetical protein